MRIADIAADRLAAALLEADFRATMKLLDLFPDTARKVHASTRSVQKPSNATIIKVATLLVLGVLAFVWVGLEAEARAVAEARLVPQLLAVELAGRALRDTCDPFVCGGGLGLALRAEEGPHVVQEHRSEEVLRAYAPATPANLVRASRGVARYGKRLIN